MNLLFDILQNVANAFALLFVASVTIGRIFPAEKVNAAAFKAGAFLSKWGIKALNVAFWNVIENNIIGALDNINSGLAAGLKSDNKE